MARGAVRGVRARAGPGQARARVYGTGYFTVGWHGNGVPIGLMSRARSASRAFASERSASVPSTACFFYAVPDCAHMQRAALPGLRPRPLFLRWGGRGCRAAPVGPPRHCAAVR